MKNISTTTDTARAQFLIVFGFVSDVMSVAGVTLLWLLNLFIKDDYSSINMLIDIPFYLVFVLLGLSCITLAIILIRDGYRHLVARREFLYKLLYFSAVIPISYITLGSLFKAMNYLALWLMRWFFF